MALENKLFLTKLVLGNQTWSSLPIALTWQANRRQPIKRLKVAVFTCEREKSNAEGPHQSNLKKDIFALVHLVQAYPKNVERN